MSDNEKIAGIMTKNAEKIKAEVLATELILNDTKGYEKQWSVNGEDVTIAVEKNA